MAVMSFVTGCIANVPVKTDRPSHSFDVNYVKTHLQSTQQELVQQLGVPGLIFRSGKDTFYVYKADADLRRVAGIGLIVPPYFVPFFTWKEEGEALHCLALVFDENGLQSQLNRTKIVFSDELGSSSDEFDDKIRTRFGNCLSRSPLRFGISAPGRFFYASKRVS